MRLHVSVRPYVTIKAYSPEICAFVILRFVALISINTTFVLLFQNNAILLPCTRKQSFQSPPDWWITEISVLRTFFYEGHFMHQGTEIHLSVVNTEHLIFSTFEVSEKASVSLLRESSFPSKCWILLECHPHPHIFSLHFDLQELSSHETRT